MGCDAHMFVQYRNKKDAKRNKKEGRDPYWQTFGGEINPGRNYAMFGILAGVRYYPENDAKMFQPKGIPDFGLGWAARNSLYLYITEDNDYLGEEHCTLDEAQKYGNKIIYDSNNKPLYVEHPDWHSHSWLTTKELKRAYRWYKKQNEQDPGLEYQVLLKMMEALENGGENEVVVVFWFDN